MPNSGIVSCLDFSQQAVLILEQLNEARLQVPTWFSHIERKHDAALGIVPITQLPASHVKTKKISYSHQYNMQQNMWEQGKLHGSFPYFLDLKM